MRAGPRRPPCDRPRSEAMSRESSDERMREATQPRGNAERALLAHDNENHVWSSVSSDDPDWPIGLPRSARARPSYCGSSPRILQCFAPGVGLLLQEAAARGEGLSRCRVGQFSTSQTGTNRLLTDRERHLPSLPRLSGAERLLDSARATAIVSADFQGLDFGLSFGRRRRRAPLPACRPGRRAAPAAAKPHHRTTVPGAM